MNIKPGLIVVLSWFLPLAAATPQGLPVRVGDRVRVRADEQYIGTVLRTDSSRMVVRLDGDPDTVAIPIAQITRLARSAGRTSGAGRGALIGAVVGGALGLAAGIDGQCGHTNSWFCVGPGAIPLFVLGGAVFGTLPGSIIGGLSRIERWEGLPLDRVELGFI